MAKQTRTKKPEILGRGKVTPVQVAFIVDRYLADNNFDKTLEAFRSEASDLFSKTKGKEAPKGLLRLAEMLDEYITLKEQRVRLDVDKRRVERALQGMHEVLHAYHPAGSIPLPPSPPLFPSQFVAAASPLPIPIHPTSYTSNGSPPGHKIHETSTTKYVQSPIILPHKLADSNFSTPSANASTKKRKSSKSSSNIPSAPKKSRNISTVEPSMTEGDGSSAHDLSSTKSMEHSDISVVPMPTNLSITSSSVQGYSVAKTLFRQPPELHTSSSPKTPAELPSALAENFVSPSLQTNDSDTVKEVASSNCSIIASETIIISPLKNAGYCSIERSYQISSPCKPTSNNKREHVRGKLDFGIPETPGCLEGEQVADENLSPSTDGELSENFDFDFPDLDIFNGDFSFSELLEDIDMECAPSSTFPVSTIPCFVHNSDDRWPETDQNLPDSSNSTVMEVLSKDMMVEGPASVTSVKTITKRVKIVTPVKSRSLPRVSISNSEV